MRPDTRVLLVDCDLQFGDVDAFLNLQSQSNISNLTKAVNDLDMDLIENVLVTHPSGLKVLIAPPHPEQAYDIASDAVRDVVAALANSYDYVVVDTPSQYDDMTLQLFQLAERIVLICNPTIPSIRNNRKMLDIFDTIENPSRLSDKVIFVLNRVVSEKDRGYGMVPTASIENHLKRKVEAAIPLDERSVLTSVNQGVPLVAKLKSRSPGREIVALAEYIRQSVEEDAPMPVQPGRVPERSKSGLRGRLSG